MEEKIKRTRSVQVRLTQEEYDFLEQKFQLSGYKSKSEFMRIAFFDTLIVKFSTEDMQELLRLVRSISNNVNQIAVRVNSTDKVYVEDMNNIKDGVEKIWQQLRYFQLQLRSVKQCPDTIRHCRCSSPSFHNRTHVSGHSHGQ